jgi:hypothetical protein
VTTIAIVPAESPQTKPNGIPRMAERSLAARRQDAIDEIHALAAHVDGDHPLFDLVVEIVRKRAELAALEIRYFDELAQLRAGRRPQ